MHILIASLNILMNLIKTDSNILIVTIPKSVYFGVINKSKTSLIWFCLSLSVA